MLFILKSVVVVVPEIIKFEKYPVVPVRVPLRYIFDPVNPVAPDAICVGTVIVLEKVAVEPVSEGTAIEENIPVVPVRVPLRYIFEPVNPVAPEEIMVGTVIVLEKVAVEPVREGTAIEENIPVVPVRVPLRYIFDPVNPVAPEEIMVGAVIVLVVEIVPEPDIVPVLFTLPEKVELQLGAEVPLLIRT